MQTIKIDMKGIRFKVYLIKVVAAVSSNIWYASHMGKFFRCAIAIKTGGNYLKPSFRVVQVTEGGVKVVGTILDIDPADCTVIKEEIMYVTPGSERLLWLITETSPSLVGEV